MEIFWQIVQLLIGTTLGTLSGFWFSLLLEKKKRPLLEIEVAEQEIATASNTKWLWVRIRNKPIQGWMSKFTDRETAYACKAQVRISSFGDNHLFFEMTGRWGDSSTPKYEEVKLEPDLIGKIAPVPDSKTMIITCDDGTQIRRRLINEQPTYDIPAGSSTILDVVFRQRGDDDCYGWNDENYLLDDWRQPINRRRLDPGQYIAEVKIQTGGQEFTNMFVIRNDEAFEKFRLEDYLKNSKHKRS
jgi:hypothetical protein